MSDLEQDPDSLFQITKRIRIHIKMKRIRKTGFYWELKENKGPPENNDGDYYL